VLVARGSVSPARQRRAQRRIRHEGGALLVCGDDRQLAEWWISTAEIDAVRRSEGVSFMEAVELLQASGCPVCSGAATRAAMN
jgi:hypothetical protein